MIFGATGAMGVLLARRFLTIYHSCTLVLYVRSARRLPEDLYYNHAVVVIEGQLDNMDNLSKAMEGVDAVITALGPTGRKGPFYPTGTPVAEAYKRIIEVMKQHEVRRLIALTTPTVRDPEDQFHLPLVVLRAAFATVCRNAVKDIVAIGEAVRAHTVDLDWTMVRLALHTSEPDDAVEPEVVAGYMGDGKTKAVSSRTAAVNFVIRELEKREWVHKAPLLSAP